MAAPIYSNTVSSVQIEGDVVLVVSGFKTEGGEEVVSTVAYTRHAANLLMHQIARAKPLDHAGAAVVPFKKSRKRAT